MRETQHNARHPTFAVAVIAMGLTPLAHAGLVQFTMTGNVANSNMAAFTVGQAFSVSFIYESTGTPDLVSLGEAFYSNRSSWFRFTSGAYDGIDDTGTFGQITKRDGGDNPDSISFQFGGNSGYSWPTNPPASVVQLPAVLSGNVSQTFENIYINLGSFSSTVWADFALPVTYNLSDFGQNHSIAMSFSGGSFGGTAMSLAISDPNQTQAAPEPATWGLSFLCAAGLTAIRRRQRQRD